MIDYLDRFQKYSFEDLNCSSYEQFEACITRLYHIIEKGLAYENYRPGFGAQNIWALIEVMKRYFSLGYDTNAFFYKTALCCLNCYLKKNKEYGCENTELETAVTNLPGEPNNNGGTIVIRAPKDLNFSSYSTLIKQRHSIRHFSNTPVDIEKIKAAISLAQCTPSACNRQPWKTRIIKTKRVIDEVLRNQNGNAGFGQEIDTLLVITSDLRYQQRSRETFQVFIDGGMYAQNLINCIFFAGIGCIPLSAALTTEQEINVRNVVGLHEAEVLILFLGLGNYPDSDFLTTKSEKKDIYIEVI